MTKGRTILMQKDNEKGKVMSNCRPLTCLPLVWKFGRVDGDYVQHLGMIESVKEFKEWRRNE